jgi:hypothetical protein
MTCKASEGTALPSRMLLIAIFLSVSLFSSAQVIKIPSPLEFFGFNMGDDYTLATYTQTEAYFKILATSPRVKLTDIGLTEEGRHQYMLVISSPDNIKNLDRYKEISGRMARAEGLSVEDAKKLAAEGKSVVWIDGGLHATEVVGSHQLIETAWQLVSRTDKETTAILDKVIILLVHANPDGQELVSSWYMKNEDPKKRKMNIPRLYQKYIGHDNNRDFYMLSMKETRNMSRQLYIEWFPQVLYNHHQSGPAGTVVAGPPYRDPFNYFYDPLLVTSIDALGAAMISRLNSEGKPGYTERTGSSFSTWYNGGLRTTAYFHNIVGLLTEIIGNPTPNTIPLVPERLVPTGATPNPVPPGDWHFRQSIDYSVSLNYAVLDYAARNSDRLLYNSYRMGMNSVEKGSRDNWTITPGRVEDMKKAYTGRDSSLSVPARRNSHIPKEYYDRFLLDQSKKDARAYIIPSDQTDLPTAVKFVNALILSGIKVFKATSEFEAGGSKFAAGSYIIRTDQAFRPYVLDMFEPQDHPNDLEYPGGPPIAPYDAAGWTLAFQMGIKFERFTEKLTGPFEQLPYGQEQPIEIKQEIPVSVSGYVLDPRINNSFIVVNDLLRDKIPVFRLNGSAGNKGSEAAGAFYIPYSEAALSRLRTYSGSSGVKVQAALRKPSAILKLKAARIAVVNRYGGSMPAGWISWIMEKYHYPYTAIYPQNLDSGNLRKKYDVIVFASDVLPENIKPADTTIAFRKRQTDGVPAEYRWMTGNLTSDRSLPAIKRFIDEGGSTVTIGPSSALAFKLGLPVTNALVRTTGTDSEVPLGNTEFYIPGSLLETSVDTVSLETSGMPSICSVYFEQDPVFALKPGTGRDSIRVLMWYPSDRPLKSGWALGQGLLKDRIAAFEALRGKGRLFAFGPEITFRSQAHSTFKLLFNQLYIEEYQAFEKRKK